MSHNQSTISQALNQIREELSVPEYLDIRIRGTYARLASHFEHEDSLLTRFLPKLSPQGSWLIGTAIKSPRGGDRVDLDAVVQLQNVPSQMSMRQLKTLVKQELLRDDAFKDAIVIPDGSRCWELRFGIDADDSEKYLYSIDILPSISNSTLQFSRSSIGSYDTRKSVSELEVKYTNKKYPYDQIYDVQNVHDNWPVSNPFGYAVWFDRQSRKRPENPSRRSEGPRMETDPIPQSMQNLDSLRRTVQILKYHRDRAFLKDRCEGKKPSSIIITTLAAQPHSGNSDLQACIRNYVSQLHSKYLLNAYHRGSQERYEILNPVCPSENFADKWNNDLERPKGFKSWLAVLAHDVLFKEEVFDESANDRLEKAFGVEFFRRALSSIQPVINARNGHSIIDPQTGHPAAVGIRARPNKNFG